MLRKNKNRILLLYVVYLYSAIPFSIIYFTNLARNVSIFFTVLNLILAIGMTVGGSYYIYKDFHTNQYIKNNSNSKLFLIFFLFCIFASIINGNAFRKFNNIYFIIHSALFFYLVLQNKPHEENYKRITNFMIIISISAISLISIINIMIFLSNKFNITESFNSQSLKDSFYFYAPVNYRWYTILSNPNTFGHLVSMSFILAIIPLIESNKKKYKIIIVIMQILSLISLIFSGSKGAIFSLAIGVVIGLMILLIHIYKKNDKKVFYFLITIILVLSIIISVLFIFIQNSIIVNLVEYIENHLLRISTIGSFTNRVGLWECLLDLPLWSKPFGYSDNFIYHYMEALQIHDYDVFLNNTGRAHNIYLQALVSFGSIGFVLFISCLMKTLIQILRNYKYVEKEFKLLYFVFLMQFIVILAGGMVEQLPLFNMSPHSLFFMFVWANLLSITEKKNNHE